MEPRPTPMDRFKAIAEIYRKQQADMIAKREAATIANDASRDANLLFTRTAEEFRRASEALADSIMKEPAS